MFRRLSVLAGCLVLLGIGATTASAAVVFESRPGTAAAPAQLGPYGMVPFSADSRPEGGSVTSVTGPLGSVRFGLPATHYRVGGIWNTWSHGYTGDVYFTGFAQSSLTLRLPGGTGAFDFYAEPDAPGTFTFTAIADGKASGPIQATWPAGAKYFGFYTTLGESLDSIVIQTDPGAFGFAIGEFRTARTLDRGPYVSSLSRKSGSTTGGDTITIRGENFSDGSGVMFGGVRASSVEVINATTLRVVTPAQAAGAYDVHVINRNGVSPQVDADAFTFVD